MGDYDDLFPLGYGYYPGIGWMATYIHDVPADWYPGAGPQYVNFANGHAANSTEPYRKNLELLKVEGQTVNLFNEDFSIAVKRVGEVGYTYNGLLQSYSGTAMERPSHVPVWTNFYGNVNIKGYALSDPQLYCVADGPCQYVPASAGCNGANGTWTYAIYLSVGGAYAMGSHHIFGNGENWVFADSSAKFKKLGMHIGGNSDFRNDPFTNYNNKGVAHGGWYDQHYCHMFAFTPDWNGEIEGTPYSEAWP